MRATRRIVFLIFAIAIAAQMAYGQKYGQPLLDSLQNELRGATKDTMKVALLNKISLTCEDINPSEGVRTGKEALHLAEQLRWQVGTAAAVNALCMNFKRKGEYDTAEVYFQKAQAIYKRLNNTAGLTDILCSIGVIYYYQAAYVQSLELELRALKMAEELGDNSLIARCSMYVGVIYGTNLDFKSALEYHLNALRLANQAGNKTIAANNLGAMGNLFRNHDEDSTALKYYSEALTLNREIGNKRGEAFNAGNIGYTLSFHRKYTEALASLLTALNLNESINDRLSMAVDYSMTAECYLSMAKDSILKLKGNKRAECLANVISNSKHALEICREMKNMSRVYQVAVVLSEAEQLSGNYPQALESYRIAMAAKDSADRNNNETKLAKLATERETELKEQQMRMNKVLQAKKRTERIFFVMGMGFLLVVITVVLRNYRLQKKTNEQKDMMMKEIHHRVKNNLQVISSLFSMQSATLEDSAAKAALADGQNRLNAIALIHQNLYQDNKPDIVDFGVLADELFSRLDNIFHKPGATVSFVNDTGKCFLSNDLAVPLGLILNELITNSYKYAFENNSAPEIMLSIHRINGRYQLAYSDNGPGFAANDKLAGGKSIGLKLIEGLSKQVKGAAAWDNTSGCGFSLVFG